MLGSVAAVAALASGVTFAVARNARTPSGKGLFVRTVRHADTPADMVSLCKSMGIDWVAICFAWQLPDGTTRTYANKEIPAYAKALRRAGIRVWLWAWPEPARGLEIAQLYYPLRKWSEGLIVDPEAPWMGEPPQAAAAAMAQWKALNVPIGVTTYGGGPMNHPHFPWRGFASADFGLPQFYDTSHKYDESNVERWLRSWREEGFKTLAPIWGASNSHSPEDMIGEARQTMIAAARAGVGIDAVSWWDYYWLELSAKRRAAVSAIEIRKVTQV